MLIWLVSMVMMIEIVLITATVYDVFFCDIEGLLGSFVIFIDIILIIVIVTSAISHLIVAVLYLIVLMAVLQHAGVYALLVLLLAVLRNLAQTSVDLLLGSALHE